MNPYTLYFNLRQRLCQAVPQLTKNRSRNIALMMTALYTAGDARFHKMAPRLPLGGKNASGIQRMRRFLMNQQVDPAAIFEVVGREMLTQAAVAGGVDLIVDTTDLERKRQVLFVGLNYRGRTLPLLWQAKLGTGCVRMEVVIALLERVKPWLPAGVPVCLVGDAEFRGTTLMDEVAGWGWKFALHLKGDTWVEGPRGWVQVRDVVTAEGEHEFWPGVGLTQQRKGPYNLACYWGKGEEKPWRLATNLDTEAETLRKYGKRMRVDEMFSDFKSRGFHLEKTNLRHADRIDRLILVVALVYVWLMFLGHWLIKRGWRREMDPKKERSYSYFQLGWRWLERCLARGQEVRIEFTCYPL